MLLETLEPKNPLWQTTLNRLTHDVYHLPHYVWLDAQRTHTIPEAILIQDGDRVFFAPYHMRSCSEIKGLEAIAPDTYDLISPYGYPSILLSEAAQQDSEFANAALAEFKQTLQKRGVCSAFFRLHPILSENFTEIFAPDTFYDNGQTVSIDLTLDEGQIWAKTRRGHQSTINKCQRLGLVGKTVSFAEYFEPFIAIYEETMDRVKAKEMYYFSRDYFQQLLQLGDRLHLGIVEAEGEMVCASLFFESCGIVQAHLGGTKTEFLKKSPFNLLLHHMRLWAKERGNTHLHIGGGVGGKKDNLFTFKSGFSKQRHQFLTAGLVFDKAKYQELTAARAKALEKTPQQLIDSEFFPAYRFG